MGCCQFLAAKLLSCSWSSPRSGGAANNGPITLKRRRAHRSWERGSPEELDIALSIFSHAVVATLAPSTTAAGVAATGILCGSWNDPHIASSFQAAGAVIGFRNGSTPSRRWRAPSSKLNHNDKGSVGSLSGGMNRARAAFQKELRTKLSSHHWRQRFNVLESIC